MKLAGHVFITGTSAYGPTGPYSDIDIGCLTRDKESMISYIWKELKIVGTSASTYNNGTYLHRLQGRPINLIPLSKRHFVAWKCATEMMKCLPPITDKNLRHSVFESLCGLAAMVPGELAEQEIEIL